MDHQLIFQYLKEVDSVVPDEIIELDSTLIEDETRVHYTLYKVTAGNNHFYMIKMQYTDGLLVYHASPEQIEGIFPDFKPEL